MKRLTDQQFDLRMTALKTRLEQTAIMHANLLDHLRPEFFRRWTYAVLYYRSTSGQCRAGVKHSKRRSLYCVYVVAVQKSIALYIIERKI